MSHINGVDGLYHVVRAFDDMCVSHEEGDIDPVRDLDIIHNELIYKDQEAMLKIKTDCENKIKRNNEKTAHERLAVIVKVEELLNNG